MKQIKKKKKKKTGVPLASGGMFFCRGLDEQLEVLNRVLSSIYKHVAVVLDASSWPDPSLMLILTNDGDFAKSSWLASRRSGYARRCASSTSAKKKEKKRTIES